MRRIRPPYRSRKSPRKWPRLDASGAQGNADSLNRGPGARRTRYQHHYLGGYQRRQSTKRRLLEAAASGAFELISSEPLLFELLEVFRREKFASRLHQARLNADAIVADIRRLAIVVTPTVIPRVVVSDPDDDQVIAAALAGSAEWIVSGDSALLAVKMFQNILIVTAADAVSKLRL